MNTSTEQNVAPYTKTFKALFTDFNYLLQLQEGHSEVVRWGDNLERNPSAREQTNSEHIVSVINLATEICYFVKKDLCFDYGMVLAAFNIHEDGEAILKRDHPYDGKKNDASGDVEEYLAFLMSKITLMNQNYELYCELEELYLLQHVTKEHKWQFFPEKAQKILLKLKKSHLLEAQIFDAIERYDYLYYCLEKQNLQTDLLKKVLNNQMPFLDDYAKKIKNFNAYWTFEKQYYARRIVK